MLNNGLSDITSVYTKKVFAHIDSVFCLLPLNVSIIKHILISIDNLSK